MSGRRTLGSKAAKRAFGNIYVNLTASNIQVSTLHYGVSKYCNKSNDLMITYSVRPSTGDGNHRVKFEWLVKFAPESANLAQWRHAKNVLE